jgi:hypothetical protein
VSHAAIQPDGAKAVGTIALHQADRLYDGEASKTCWCDDDRVIWLLLTAVNSRNSPRFLATVPQDISAAVNTMYTTYYIIDVISLLEF